MRAPIKMNEHNQQGYILIELAIVMVVIGFLIAAALPFYNSFVQRDAPRNTQDRIIVLENALSNYIQTRFRLPCPADPDPTASAGGDFGLERGNCNGAAQLAHGIVPYRTLGIPEQYAKDGFGNFFTYVVSPHFTLNNELAGGPDLVHRRLIHHFADSLPVAVGDDLIDKNPALYSRAIFCAPINSAVSVAQGRDITVIQDGNTLDLVPDHFKDDAAHIFRKVTPATDVRAVGLNTTDANLNRDAFVSAVAVGIVSHGRNGYGSYQSNGNASPFPAIIPATSAEQVTANDGNRTISLISVPDDTGADEYDDIVSFYTQEEIYAIAGGGSCEHL